MIVINVLVHGIIISVISVYVPQCGLDDREKNDSYDSLANVIRKLRGIKLVITGDFNGNPKITKKTMRTSMGGYGYGFRSKKGERILEFCATMNMTVGNTLFTERASHLVTDESGLLKTQVDCLVRRSQKEVFERYTSLT